MYVEKSPMSEGLLLALEGDRGNASEFQGCRPLSKLSTEAAEIWLLEASRSPGC